MRVRIYKPECASLCDQCSLYFAVVSLGLECAPRLAWQHLSLPPLHSQLRLHRLKHLRKPLNKQNQRKNGARLKAQ